MRSILTQAAVIIVVAGAVGGYFAFTRPPTLGTPASPGDRPAAAPGTSPAAPKSDASTSGTSPQGGTTKPESGTTEDPSKKPSDGKQTPPPQPKVDPKPPQAKASPAATPAKPERMISLERAKKLFDDQSLDGKSVVFVDAREYWHYTDEHVLGAMHVDKRYFDGAAPKKVLNYLPGNVVVVYCMGADCTDSEAVAQRLEALNLNIGPIFVMKDGLPAWINAKYPTAKGGEVGFSD